MLNGQDGMEKNVLAWELGAPTMQCSSSLATLLVALSESTFFPNAELKNRETTFDPLQIYF